MASNRILLEEFQKSGFSVRTASIAHIKELEDEITALKKQGVLDGRFCEENLHWLDFDSKNNMPDAKTIIVIACPQYISRLILEYSGRKHVVIIPPTYVFSELDARVGKLLDQVLAPNGHRSVKTRLPAKLLAVRTGMGAYGRNNVCYINGMGSFHRIFTFYSDMPCLEDSWYEKVSMPECESCCSCIRACPTGCIDSDRFLIHAEKCITNFNEKEQDFPVWLDKGWHNAVVGCMKCQLICPKNAEHIRKIDRECVLGPDEVEMLLKKLPLSQVPPELKLKLDKLDLNEYYDVLHRNLSVLLPDIIL